MPAACASHHFGLVGFQNGLAALYRSSSPSDRHPPITNVETFAAKAKTSDDIHLGVSTEPGLIELIRIL
jgi:hypothetical protein